MLLAMASLAMASNFIIILQKFRRGRWFDASLDFVISGVCGLLLIGSYVGMCMAAFASMLISIYLWFNPIDITLSEIASVVKEATTDFFSEAIPSIKKIFA